MARKIAIKKKMWCFWNEDRKVEQVGGISTNSTFELLLSNSTGDSTEIGGVKKASGLTYNPSTKTLITSSLLNGLSINADKIEFSNTTQQTGSLTTTQLYFTDESNPGTVNSMKVTYNDVVKSTKWDGTNTSLYSALAGKVSKAGDTMSGNLTISKEISNYYIVKTNTYAINNTSNNGMSSTQTIGGWLTRDKNDANLSNIFTNMGSDGSVTLTAYAGNKKTDGTSITNSISIVAKKDGSLTYNVSSPANFRSAIGAGTSSLAIGTTSTTAAAGNHNHNGTYCYGSVRIVAGTVIRSVGDVQWFAPFTTAQIKSLLGISATPSAGNTYVNYTNGDTSAHNFTFTGTSWMSGVPNAVFSAKKGGTGNVRFNYIIAYFG